MRRDFWLAPLKTTAFEVAVLAFSEGRRRAGNDSWHGTIL